MTDKSAKLYHAWFSQKQKGNDMILMVLLNIHAEMIHVKCNINDLYQAYI